MLQPINLRQLADQYQSNCERINAIADLCEAEERGRNEAEEAEFATLTRTNQALQMRMHAANARQLGATVAPDPQQRLREVVASGRDVHITMQRDIQLSDAVAGTGIIPVNEGEMLTPLRAGLIYDKVGIRVGFGLAGSYRWPSHTKAVAAFAGEGERLADSKIDFDKLEASPVRFGIAIPISREEIDGSNGVVESLVRNEIPRAVIDLVNDAMFTTSKTYTDKGGATKNKKVYGPFASITPTVFAGAVPTRKELLKLKSAVAGAGIEMTAPCWVMTESMKAELEDTRVDAGSGRFVCENDNILGYPVFTTPAIGEGYVGFGDWSYQVAGFFGGMEIVADTATLLRQHAVDFVLNGQFGTATLRPEAFALGKAKA